MGVHQDFLGEVAEDRSMWSVEITVNSLDFILGAVGSHEATIIT